ncbi:HAD family hydrolase [Thermostaphylospora chromogena]|jgi:putative hydrolase of the HAD superfamily|uniref:Putative hydrolase of the HAD superfamily n=1 Tax=Thermostaphylospora chromogena TaxID=35622 RepID=A0A1H1H4F6_9ACTN|nr:HAD family phosphatase [Thermostaphylospora chromogena]SDR19988.1 putative hydrolase of the HAD superfamily [Thermostaphylospora chromogena]
MTWILVDYGGVISHQPPQEAAAPLAQALDVEPERFWQTYWRHRDAYDRAELDATTYWSRVCADIGKDLDPHLLDSLIALDLNAWTYLNRHTLKTLTELAERGIPLALLSNAPTELARLIDTRPWATLFRYRFFSADLRLSKPDPRIYRQVCERLPARPQDVLFIDDRPDNIRAAEETGIRTLLFTDAPQLRADLTAYLQPAGS